MSKVVEIREIQAVNTLVFETLGQPEREREFKFKALKRWGLDLLAGKKNGVDTFFTAELETRKAGDKYTEGDVQFEVKEVLKEMPRGKKIFAHIEMVDGTAYFKGELREGDENVEIFWLPAGTLLMAFLKKNKLTAIIEALRNIGTAAELVRKQGDEGKPLPYEELPSDVRKFLKEAKKIERETEFGRLALAYFGTNKSGRPRYRISWLLPTVAFFELDIAVKINKLLESFE